jgi:hypothetical protein
MKNQSIINWISEDEKDPENGINVLTYSPQNNGGIGITVNYHSDGIYRFLETGKENKFPISHWAYLPDAPEDDFL